MNTAPFQLESVTAQQLGAEQRRAAQRSAILTRQLRPLKGDAGEYGTPDLLDNTAGPMALFNQRLDESRSHS